MPQNTTNGTKRIVIPEKVVQLAEEIQGLLGVSSIGEVFAVLLTRYGSHLKTSWELKPMQPASPTPPPLSEPRLTLVQPLTEPEQDPIIARMATLIENF
jgi:hypothetical protein